jgi:hypothetical protein
VRNQAPLSLRGEAHFFRNQRRPTGIAARGRVASSLVAQSVPIQPRASGQAHRIAATSAHSASMHGETTPAQPPIGG